MWGTFDLQINFLTVHSTQTKMFEIVQKSLPLIMRTIYNYSDMSLMLIATAEFNQEISHTSCLVLSGDMFQVNDQNLEIQKC